jgi:hypothetical protein
LYHKIEYTNELGNDRSIELTNLKDFFMWRWVTTHCKTTIVWYLLWLNITNIR